MSDPPEDTEDIDEAVERPTLWQRSVFRSLRREAGKDKDAPLTEDDWAVLWGLESTRMGRLIHRTWAMLPGHQRCGICSAPFEGPGRLVVRPLGYRPSRKNPTLCATCVEASPPGGMTMDAGVLFADLRGFTKRSEGLRPSEVSAMLRRFYGCAEDVLFPEAVIDKLIGDEVMALYLPRLTGRFTRQDPPSVMVEHAQELLRAVGYGSAEGPFVELGVGLDFGEAYVGNIGDRAVYDFTAVGDVVNTASRLQGQAAGGEVVISGRVADRLEELPGDPEELTLKGKEEPVRAFRLVVS